MPDDAVKPTIAYVDEQENARADFFTDAYQSELFEDVLVLEPALALDDMLGLLLELPIDALVSDFLLTEAGPVAYEGTALVAALAKARKGFPCFIRTSYDAEALQAADDVNRVYSKNPVVEGDGREKFFERIALQARRYREKILGWQDELEELAQIETGNLTAVQIERIVELDSALEQVLGADDAMPARVKLGALTGEGLTGRETELIEQTEKLIADMKAKLADNG